MKRKIKIILLLIFTYSISYSEEFTLLRGKVFDAQTGEPLFAANVGVKGTSTGTSTDFDGHFEIRVTKSKPVLIVSYIGYNTIEITDFTINNSVVVLNDINLTPNTISIETITISEEAKRNTDVALLVVKQKSPILMDAISAQSFKKSGDGNVASAVKRVPGISISNGKYVYIRGLGDRYTKTQLNNIDLPGLDPDRNAIQIDIFPTNIIDNIKVYKSFSVNLPADFSGGIVDIATNAFPDKKELNISSSIAFNSSSNIKSNFLSFKGGKFDFLGFDDGTYKLPVNKNLQITRNDRILNYNKLISWSNSFNKNLAVTEKTSLLDGGFSFSSGNQFTHRNKKIGYISALSYSNNYQYYSEVEQNYWRKPIETNKLNLEPAKLIEGKLGIQNANLSAMLGLGLKNEFSKYKINLLFLKNSEKKAGVFFGENFYSNVNQFKKDILEYSERSLANLMISSTHNFKNQKFIFDWKISQTFSRIRDNDFRETPYLLSINNFDTTYILDVSNIGEPKRMWRYLDEGNFYASSNILFKHTLINRNAKLNSGISYLYKNRNYNVIGYSFTAYENGGSIDLSGHPNEIMNLLLDETNDTLGFHVIGGEQLSNRYSGTIYNTSAYVSEEFFVTKNLKSVLGVRSEYYQQYYTGQNQSGEKYINKNVLSDFTLFPSLNLIYSLNEQSKLRFSMFKTTARPSFKEKSLAAIYDGVSNITFNGNIDLQVSSINNFDLRYESYLNNNQTYSLSFFHKDLFKPIEIASFQADPDNIQPINTDKASITGLEIEIKKNIYSNLVNKIFLSLNSSIIRSKAFIKGEELKSRIENLRLAEKISQSNGDYFRKMQGQAPYIINLALQYKNIEKSLETGFYYNVQGKTLSIVSMNANPDVFTSEFHSLNFVFQYKIMSKINLSFKINNLLNEKKNMVTMSHGADEEIFKTYNPGRVFKLNVSYKL